MSSSRCLCLSLLLFSFSILALGCNQLKSGNSSGNSVSPVSPQATPTQVAGSSSPLPPATAFAQGQTPPKQSSPQYNCSKSTHRNALGSAVEGMGAEIGLFDETTRSRIGTFKLDGSLWFFDGGKSTEVGKDTYLQDFSFRNYHPDPKTLKLCSSGKYFILSTGSRRFRILFPSPTFAAFILEIK